jgi:hypothetical protein
MYHSNRYSLVILLCLQFIPKISMIDGYPSSFSNQVLALIIQGLIYNENGLSAEILLMTRDEVSFFFGSGITVDSFKYFFCHVYSCSARLTASSLDYKPSPIPSKI